MLRQPLIVLNRQVKRPQLYQGDRLRLVLSAKLTRYWQQALHIVQPDMLLRWHRNPFRLYGWRQSKSNKCELLSGNTDAALKIIAQEIPNEPIQLAIH